MEATNLTDVDKSPGLLTPSSMDYLIRGHMLTDVPAVLGSLDIVLVRWIDEFKKVHDDQQKNSSFKRKFKEG